MPMDRVSVRCYTSSQLITPIMLSYGVARNDQQEKWKQQNTQNLEYSCHARHHSQLKL
uniref:Uncharacterized protein n=1 Tax=Timema douglasi TaxID=61478 RepID=A0A7R8ZFF6_TIMDO|nr:unnamed protein product [Timema douglasi]